MRGYFKSKIIYQKWNNFSYLWFVFQRSTTSLKSGLEKIYCLYFPKSSFSVLFVTFIYKWKHFLKIVFWYA